MLIDSHAHYDDGRFDGDRDEAIALARSAGVDMIINAASDVASSEAALALATKYDFFRALAGVHPHEAEKELKDPDFPDKIAKLLENEKTVAIGEIGLDYYYDLSERDLQKRVFIMQMELAKKLKVPVVIHTRDAIGDTVDILRRYPGVTGVVHSFSGSAEMLDEILKMGYYVSLGGIVTFKNARLPVEVARLCPKDRLLLETDCPYLTPVPHRGERNGSHFIRYTAQQIAEIRKEDTEELINTCAENTLRAFNIKI